MFEDLRSPEYKADMEKRLEADRRKRQRAGAKIAKLRREITGWQPIETCPFAAYDSYYGDDRAVLFTDGESVAVSFIHKRFGRPIKCVKEPTMAMTDHGMMYVGGEYEEYDRPKWWFDYELDDALENDSDFGRPEIGFLPTHWLPMPAPPTPDRSGEAGETPKSGLNEGESGLPEGSS